MKNFLKRHTALVVAACVGVAVVGGGAAAAAATASAARPTLDLTAATSAASGSSTGTSTLGKAGRAGRLAKLARLARRSVHGDLLVKTKNGYQTVTFDRGKVTAASATSVSIQRPDGVSVTETLTSSTKYLGISGESGIVTGKGAILVSRNGTALAVAQRPVSTGTSGSGTARTGAGSGSVTGQ